MCGSTVVREPGEVNHRCTGGLFCCAARRKQALPRQRRAVEIEGLGDKLVDQLVDGGLVRTLPDLYKLGVMKLAALDRMADKSAQNIVAALEKSKQTTLPRFLFGLGIRHVGEATAKAWRGISARSTASWTRPKSNCWPCATWGQWWPAASAPFLTSPTTARWWSSCRRRRDLDRARTFGRRRCRHLATVWQDAGADRYAADPVARRGQP